jgi:hypothetical protein
VKLKEIFETSLSEDELYQQHPELFWKVSFVEAEA